MNSFNIVLNFSANKAVENITAGQPLAVMPADLAKRLLQNYAAQLRSTSTREIIEQHIDKLRECGSNMDAVITTSVEFVQERELIQNIVNENWDAYKVEDTTV